MLAYSASHHHHDTCWLNLKYCFMHYLTSWYIAAFSKGADCWRHQLTRHVVAAGLVAFVRGRLATVTLLPSLDQSVAADWRISGRVVHGRWHVLQASWILGWKQGTQIIFGTLGPLLGRRTKPEIAWNFTTRARHWPLMIHFFCQALEFPLFMFLWRGGDVRPFRLKIIARMYIFSTIYWKFEKNKCLE